MKAGTFATAVCSAFALALSVPAMAAKATEESLRVCADANNLPFTNERLQGFENALAELLAEELGRELSYAWWPQRRGFIRNTLNDGKCDLVMGVPADYPLTATTRPYYRSSYVLVTREADDLSLEGLEDPRLRELRIGMHTIGDDYGNPPPAQLLGLLGVRDNVRGYSIYGDYSRPDPPRELIDALAGGDIDVAIAWGPTAGYFARQQARPLRLTAIPTTMPRLPMSFDIALGLRREDEALRERLDQVLVERRADIEALLQDFGIPTLPLTADAPEGEQGETEAQREQSPQRVQEARQGGQG